MALSDMVFGATNLKSGLDADKPLNPSPGDIYVSIDTEMVYVCYVSGNWSTYEKKEVWSNLDYIETIGALSGTANLWSGNSPTKVGGSFTIDEPNLNKKKLYVVFGSYCAYSSSHHAKCFMRINGGAWVEKYSYQMTNSWNYSTKAEITGINTGDVIEIAAGNTFPAAGDSRTTGASITITLEKVQETKIIIM